MKRSAFFVSLLITTACTQPAAMVEYRGNSDYGRSGSGYAGTTMAAPVASVSSNSTYTGASQPIYNADRAKQDQTVASSGSIGVSELEPAAGGSPSDSTTNAAYSNAVPANSKGTVLPMGSPNSKSTEAQIDHYDSEMEDAKAAGKTVVLNKPDDATPTNSWTGKSRDASKFASDSTGPKAAGDSKFIWPTGSKKVTSSADGITISAKEGEPVWAAADGEIVYADNKMKGYGNMVLVKHHGGKTTTYAHLARISVDKYDRVKQGDIIGYVGKTGGVKKPQLFFSMKDGSKTVDPQKYLDRNVAGL